MRNAYTEQLERRHVKPAAVGRSVRGGHRELESSPPPIASTRYSPCTERPSKERGAVGKGGPSKRRTAGRPDFLPPLPCPTSPSLPASETATAAAATTTKTGGRRRTRETGRSVKRAAARQAEEKAVEWGGCLRKSATDDGPIQREGERQKGKERKNRERRRRRRKQSKAAFFPPFWWWSPPSLSSSSVVSFLLCLLFFILRCFSLPTPIPPRPFHPSSLFFCPIGPGQVRLGPRPLPGQPQGQQQQRSGERELETPREATNISLFRISRCLRSQCE